ncbi:ATPase, T2SS/T4P/T4SS family [Viridibacillus arvi]|uniref:ATPase, T2SS/T4P/T4SS family n=1 Tax=Viridibacillus arvi TaxID=263475 RepID=UPI0034CF4B45
MSFWLNAAGICLIFVLVVGFVTWKIRQQDKDLKELHKSELERARFKIDTIVDFTKNRMTELTTINLYGLGLSEEEFNRRKRRRQELKEALKSCNTGDRSSKIYVREIIFDLLKNEYGFDEEKINWPIAFNNPSQMSAREQFDTILYLFEKEYKESALEQLIEKYNLGAPKPNSPFNINEDEIRNIYKKEVRQLKFEDKLYIISQRIYSAFKGFGVIDEIRDMNIDGVSGGVSGLPKRMEQVQSDNELVNMLKTGTSNMNSVWVMFKGKSIHFSFLSFEHEAEIRRVVTNIYKYGYPGQLSESRPYIINEMYDGSRVTVMRPKLAESWAFFIRKKYDAKKLNLNELISHSNKELPISVLKFLMMGNQTTAITGEQGSGKTTLLLGLIKHIRATYNLRMQETSFELNARSLYPDRNILTFQETDNMSGQDGLDLQKKTDGNVNIVGEAATDAVAAWVIQTGQVASKFTLFTHHAYTAKKLVEALRNSLMKTGMFSNESIAEQQVLSVLGFDVQLRVQTNGERYIERITEFVPIEYSLEVQEMAKLNEATSKEDKMDFFLEAATTYFRQQTKREQYIAQNIIEYRDGQYVAVNKISDEKIKDIATHLDVKEREAFFDFIKQVWGDN